MMADSYDFKRIEEKWIKKFEELGAFHTDVKNSKKTKFYNLAMFPYPSAASLHMGHAYTYGGVDTYGRFKRHMGYNVFQPMGFDAFGIHGENYAIKVNRHPSDVLEENTINFRRQMDRLGAMFDWSHSVNTTDPDYYKWTQWIFVQLYKAGLAERKSSLVNWCPSCKTVLSDEQVIQGKCERCGTLTEKKEMLQWFFKITDYAQKLLDNHEKIDWSAKTVLTQKNWIGRSEGAEISFSVVDEEGNEVPEKITVFTTRPDTLFGATFVVLSIKHELIARIPNKYYEKVNEYIVEAQSQTALDTQKDKTGEFTGLYALNPLSGERIPVFVANYVLPGYGTGALMGVPGHDERDFEFANKYGIEIKRVIESEEEKLPYDGEGKLIDSGEYTGMESFEAREKLTKELEEMGVGKEKINYKLRDWLVSRQRYWGPPIPIVYCDECGTVPVEDLPVFLPNIEDFTPKGDGKSPLASIESFVNTTCPKCGGKARRETDVIDNFVDSSWYFLRYPSVGINDKPFDEELTKKWLPVDMYIGGNEHAVLHLLYTRFIVMALHDLGYLDFDEPFNKFRVNGLIIKDGAKMSKSKGNVVNPDDFMNLYGTDVVRMYLMFIGPFSDGGDFSEKNIVGIARFLDRVWGMLDLKAEAKNSRVNISDISNIIADITEDLDNLRYNTAISSMMEYVNWVYKNYQNVDEKTLSTLIENFVIMVSVFAPFVSEEMWEKMGNKGLALDASWPKVKRVKLESMQMPIQVNGKLRAAVTAPMDASEKQISDLAFADETVKRFVGDNEVKKIIFVKNKIINIII